MTFLTIVFLIIFMVGAAGGTYKGARELKHRKTYALSRSGYTNLSWPAKWIVLNYAEIPVSHRPFEDVAVIVKALDLKNGVENVNNHFKSIRIYLGGGNYHYPATWDCRCHTIWNRTCPYESYHNIKKSIEKVKNSLEEHARAVEVAKVAGQLENADALVERLNAHADAISKDTKELV